MISPSEIKEKAERKYISFLQSAIQDIPFSNIIISGDKKPSKVFSELQKEISALVSRSKEHIGYGYIIDYQLVKTKIAGEQSLPTAIYFDSSKDYLKYLGKEKEFEVFIKSSQVIIPQFPELKSWIIKYPMKVIANHNLWGDILKVCTYFKTNSCPNLYIRELPINVHTKFIENNKGVIRELLDIIASQINEDEKDFEKRFNLKYKEPLIRFRVLDSVISQKYFSGLSDLSIPMSHFEQLDISLKKVFVVENKITLYTTLTLPNVDSSIAIFGSGYAVQNLKNTQWLDNVDLFYWGDIDVHGFEILSQFRGYFPNVKSFLMDRIIFEMFFESDQGVLSNVSNLLYLKEDEQELYDLIKKNNWRLEQEKIPFEVVNRYITSL